MIFLTVGSQMPFDRLVSAVDAWAAASGAEVFAQIGETTLQPTALRWQKALAPAEFRRAVQACTCLIGHAGMGTVLTGLEFGKPMLLMPRRGPLGETRNDHQVDTLRWLATRPGIHAVYDVDQLNEQLAHLAAGLTLTAPPPAGSLAAASPATQGLVSALRRFIES